MVAIRTARLLSTIAKVVVVAIVAVGVIAAISRPDGGALSESVQTWAIRLAIGIPVLFALEMLGTLALSRPFLEKQSSAGRIAIIASVVVIAIAAVFGVVQVAKTYAL